MLTRGELEAVGEAERGARAALERLELEADRVDAARLPGWRWLFPSDERRAATSSRAVLEAALAARDRLLELPDYDHEEVARLVEVLRSLGHPGWATAALADNTVGDVTARKARELVAALPGLLPSPAWLKLLLVVVGLVALVVLLAPVLGVLRALAPRRA